jgi:hypothetical protein
MPRLLILLWLIPLAACAPSHSELYPDESGWWMRNYSVTHDPHHPWQFQKYNSGDGGR